MLCFPGPNVPRKMDGESLSRDGCGTAPAVPGPWSDQECCVTTASGVALHNLSFEIWRTSRAKASLSHLQLSVFEESLVSHQSFVSTSSTFSFGGEICTKASLSHLQLSGFWGKSRTKASFSHLQLSLRSTFHFRKDVSHEMRFARLADARNAVFCRTKGASEDRARVSGTGSVGPRCSCRFRRRFPNLSAPFLKGISHESSFSHLPLSDLEGKFRKVSHESFLFASSTFRFCGQVSHQGFVFTSSTFSFGGKASHQSFVFASSTFTFSGKPCRNVVLRVSGMHEIMYVFCGTKRALEDGWGSSAAGRLQDGPGCTGIMVGSKPQCSYCFRCRFARLELQYLKDVSQESFVFKSSTLIFCGKVSKESFLFTSSTLSFWGNVSHERFGFTPSTFRFGGTSFTRGSFSHLQLSVLEGHLALKLRFHIFNCQIFGESLPPRLRFDILNFQIWTESFAPKLRFHIFNFRFWRESLAPKLRFHIFHFHWGKPRTKASFSHLQLSDLAPFWRWWCSL